MKYAAFLMVFILLASLVGVGYVYMTASVVVQATGVQTAEAVSQPEVFTNIQAQMSNGAVIGTPYTTQIPMDIAGYQLVTYRLQLRNDCFVPAEMVEIQVTPREGDVLQLGSDQGAPTLAPHSTQILETTILTNVDLYTMRELNITYYIWGRPFSIRTTIGS